MEYDKISVLLNVNFFIKKRDYLNKTAVINLGKIVRFRSDFEPDLTMDFNI